MRKYLFLSALVSVILITSLYPNNNYFTKIHFSEVTKASQSSFKIKQRNPVVNEGNHIQLSIVNTDGSNTSTGVTWESGSPDIAQVNPNTGEVSGLKSGFATITARRADESFSIFVIVAKVRKANGSSVPGDTKTDVKGSVYISNPLQNTILKADNSLNAPVKPYAGKAKVAGNRNGFITEALFAGPTAIGVDNSANGGIYIADTLNHSIRRIGFDKQVDTVLGKGFPGTSSFTSSGNDFNQVFLSSPRGVVIDNGGNLYIADTDNNAIYYADFTRRKVSLIAGEPGLSGKEDGVGRSAKFRRPAGMALSNDGRLLTVADQDNDRVRLIELSRNSAGELIGNVSTLGVATSSQGIKDLELNQEKDEIAFDKPQSVSIDGTGNIYIVDQQGVQLVTRPFGQMPEVISLAQPQVTFNKAVSVTIKGTEAFVLDSDTLDTQALSVVSVAGPEITSIDPPQIKLNENTEVVIKGRNFAPESQIVFAGKVIQPSSIKAEEIRFQLLPQALPGIVTFSILTRGGIAQKELNIVAKPASLLGTGEITTIAGGSIFLGNGGRADLASLGFSGKTVVDSVGNLFVIDGRENNIRRVDKQTGTITSIAGGGTSLDNGVLAITASITPLSIALDKSGNMLLIDGFTKSVRKVDTLTGTITTVAGAMGRSFQGDGKPAIEAGFDDLSDLAFDQNDNLLILESTRLRRIDKTTGIINTIAGNGTRKFSGDNGPALKAGFLAVSLAVDTQGNIFIADRDSNRIRKINKDNIISTVVGNGKKKIQSIDPKTRDGKPATQVSLFFPTGIAVDANNNLYLEDIAFLEQEGVTIGNSAVISKVNLTTGIITTQQINDINNQKILPSTSTPLSTDGLGNLFFNDLSSVFQLDTKSGNASRVVGNSKFNFSGDEGLSANASIGNIIDVITDQLGNIYLADITNSLIRMIDTNTGRIRTIAGGDNSSTVGNGDGGPAQKAVIYPTSLGIDNQGNLLIGTIQNNRGFIRRIDLKTSIITTIAGSNTSNFVGVGKPALETRLASIFGITTDSQGNIYFLSNGLRKIDAKTGIVSTLANFANSGIGDLVADKDGNLFIAIGTNFVFRYDTKTGKMTTFAGGSFPAYSGDGGPATQAGLGVVEALAIDAQGNLFIGANSFSLSKNNSFLTIPRIWRVDSRTNIITTVVTSKDGAYSGDGGAASNASLAGYSKITTDQKGNLFVSSTNIGISALRQIKLSN